MKFCSRNTIKKYIYIYFLRRSNCSRGGQTGSCPSNLSPLLCTSLHTHSHTHSDRHRHSQTHKQACVFMHRYKQTETYKHTDTHADRHRHWALIMCVCVCVCV